MKGCLNGCIFLKHSTVCTLHVKAFNLFVVTFLHMSSVVDKVKKHQQLSGVLNQ